MRCRSCPPLPEEVRRTAHLLERRWAVSIIYVSHEGAVRFNEFLQALGSIPPATLAQRLADLEGAGIFEREVVDQHAGADDDLVVVDARPPRVEYRLTARGHQLRSMVNALARFAETA